VTNPQRPHDPERLGSRIDRKQGKGPYRVDLRWLGHGRLVLRDPENPGWPKEGRTTTCRETGKKWAAKYDEHYLSERDNNDQNQTGDYRQLGVAAKAFVRHRKIQNANSTASGSATALKHLIEEVGEQKHPRRITHTLLQNLCDEFLEEGYEVHSVRNTVNHLIVFFDFIEVDPNPARAVKLPAAPKNRAQPWTESALEEIRAAADQIDTDSPEAGVSRRRLVECLLGMGPRAMEAGAIVGRDFDPGSKTSRINGQIDRRTGKVIRTKGKEGRTVVVLPEWWTHHVGIPDDLLFVRADGSPLRGRQLYDIVREILEQADVKKTGEAVHKFRHTYAYHFLKRGGTMGELQKSLGHKRLSTTEDYYDHFTSDEAAESAVSKIYGKKSVRRGPRKGR
jgi:integrase